MLLASDEEVQEIANRLYISRAMLYRYISSLNKNRYKFKDWPDPVLLYMETGKKADRDD